MIDSDDGSCSDDAPSAGEPRGSDERHSAARARAARVEALFDAALELPPGEREAFLANACGDDPTLGDDVLRLLSHVDPTGITTPPPRHPSTETPPAALGRYRIVGLLNSGGQGSVYRATDDDLPDTPLALKVVSLHPLDVARRQRFELEVKALTSMRHEHVVRVYGVGTAPDGSGFIAMDLVGEATTITRYADARALSLPERLALIRQVCDGMQHAHAKGHIHRDLKPANLLVEEIDGAPRVRIIDFGVCKPVPGSDAPHRDVTAFEQLVGTPRYMSPEQAEGGDIDALSDVYAIGVVLYELIAGETPFHDELGSVRTALQIRSILCHRVPEPPSVRAARRGREDLARAARGDVDRIVMKCLALRREERYRSVLELDADLDRYQRGMPIAARGRSPLYAARKFARRNWITLTGTGIALGACVAALAFWMHTRSVAAESRANAERQLAADRVHSLTEMFEQLNSAEVADGVRERLMADIGQRIDRSGGSRILTAGAVSGSGTVPGAPGAPGAPGLSGPAVSDAARALLERSVEGANLVGHVRDALAESIVLPSALRIIADPSVRPDDLVDRIRPHLDALHAFGAHDQIVSLLTDLLPVIERSLGPDDPVTLQLVSDLGAATHAATGDPARSAPLLRRAAEGRRRVLGASHELTLETQITLLDVLRTAGDVEGFRACRDEIEPHVRTAFSTTDVRRVLALGNLALAYYIEGGESSVARSRSLLDEALALSQTIGPTVSDKRGLIPLKLNMGVMLANTGEADRGIAILEETVAESESALGGRDDVTVRAIMELGTTLGGAGRFTESALALERALDRAERGLGAGHATTSMVRGKLATAYVRDGRPTDAIPLYRAAVAERRATLPWDDRETLEMGRNLGVVLGREGECDEAIEHLAAVVSIGPRQTPATRRFQRMTLGPLGPILARDDRFDEAMSVAEETFVLALLDAREPGSTAVADSLAGLREIVALWELSEGGRRARGDDDEVVAGSGRASAGGGATMSTQGSTPESRPGTSRGSERGSGQGSDPASAVESGHGSPTVSARAPAAGSTTGSAAARDRVRRLELWRLPPTN